MVTLPDPQKFHSLFFDLQVNFYKKHIKMRMEMFTDDLYSSGYPETQNILNIFLPEIYNCYCFNYKKQAFSEEVKDTEIGHLFEHMVLECLAEHDLSEKRQHNIYNGVTSWNWENKREGLFYIKIDVPAKEQNVVSEAISKAIRIIDLIIGKAETQTVVAPVAAQPLKVRRTH